MKLAINQKYRIISDRQQWTIQEKRTRKGESEWMPIMYFGTFAKAPGELGELMVRESNATTLVKGIRGRRKGHHPAVPSPHTPIEAAVRARAGGA